MNERDEMMAAIKADPLDDTVRLVFADWLDDQNNSTDADRARFIRAQIELARIGPQPIEISSVLRSHGPDYWSAILSGWDTDVKVGDRVDFEEEASLRRTKKGKWAKLRKFHRLCVVRVDVDDPSLGTRIVYLKRDEHSVPWPKERVDELTAEASSLLTKNWRWWSRLMFEGWLLVNSEDALFDITDGNLVATFDRGFISKITTDLPTKALAPMIEQYPITDVEFTGVPVLIVGTRARDGRELEWTWSSFTDLPPMDADVPSRMFIATLGSEHSIDDLWGHPSHNHYSICRKILSTAFPTVPNWRFPNGR